MMGCSPRISRSTSAGDLSVSRSVAPLLLCCLRKSRNRGYLTLTSGGQTWTVPGRTTSSAYEMSNGERAQGTLKPAIRFSRTGGIHQCSGNLCGADDDDCREPVTLSAYVQDRGNREDYPENKIMLYQVGTEWLLHQGPEGAVPEFSNPVITGRDRAREAGESASGDWTEVTTQATFPNPVIT